MRLSCRFVAALGGAGLAMIGAAPGPQSPLPPPPPGQVQMPGLAPIPFLPHLPSPPLPADPQLRVALSALNDLEALVGELRYAEPGSSVTPQLLDDLTREMAAHRARIQRLADQVGTGTDEEAPRTARVVIQWVSQASKPLYLARMARLRNETEQLRSAVEKEYAHFANRIPVEDPFPGELEFTHRQARAYWDEGNSVAAAATYQRLRILTAAALQETNERQEARQAQRAARNASQWAHLVQAERYAAASQRRARDLASAAEAAFAQGDYRTARSDWEQASVCFDQAMELASPLYRLDLARDRYEAVSLALQPGDLVCPASESEQLAHCLIRAHDEHNELDVRTAGYEQATRVLVPVRLQAARALQEQKPEAALDHLSAILNGFPRDAEARTLFNALADRPGWWLACARAESQQVHRPHYRLPLYALLARTRRLLGDNDGAARARLAGVALVEQQIGQAWVPPPVFELLNECLDAGDGESCRSLLDLAGKAAPPRSDPWRRALWLAHLAGFATRAGESAVAETLRMEALELLPGYAGWVEAEAASAAGHHTEALQHWRELAQLVKEPAKHVSARTVIDLGGHLVEAAAEARDEETARTLRAEVLQAAEKQTDATKDPVRWRLALVDAYQARWEQLPSVAKVPPPPAYVRTLARIRAQNGEVGVAMDLLENVTGPESAVVCWHIGAAFAASAEGDRATLLEWVRTLPDAESRCTAFLGAASRIGKPSP
jgi:hypothetical protein